MSVNVIVPQSKVPASYLNMPDKRQNAFIALDQPFGTLFDSQLHGKYYKKPQSLPQKHMSEMFKVS